MKKINDHIKEYAKYSDSILQAIIEGVNNDEVLIQGDIQGFTEHEILQQLQQMNINVSSKKLNELLTLLVREKLIQKDIENNQETKYSITTLGQLLYFKGGKNGEIKLKKAITRSSRLTLFVALLSAFATLGSMIIAFLQYKEAKSAESGKVDVSVISNHQAKSIPVLDTTITYKK